MKIFGYAFGSDVQQKPEEVSFQGTSEELRQISQFMLFSAKRMEKYGEKYGHDPLKDFLKASDKPDGPDVIVAHYSILNNTMAIPKSRRRVFRKFFQIAGVQAIA
jgi:hypothetical protein